MMPKPGECPRLEVIRDYFDLVSQTAEFRCRICWEGARRLFSEQGFSASDVIQITCDQGNDVHGTFALANGTLVSCDLKEDPQTRQAVAFTSWDQVDGATVNEDDDVFALHILENSHLRLAFDAAVQAFYDFHWRDCDRPLPARAKR